VNARAGGGGAQRAGPWEAGVRFSPAATAAAAALLPVTWSMVTFPAVPLASRLDALANEWIIWFTAFYLPAFAADVLLRRFRAHRSPSPLEGEGAMRPITIDPP